MKFKKTASKGKTWGKAIFLSLVAGLLINFSFAPFSIPSLLLFSLLILFVGVNLIEERVPFLFFISGLSFFLFHFSWLLPYGFFPWFLLSLTQSLFWALFGFLFKKFKNPFYCSFLWAGVEVLKSLGPWGFSWGALGYTQTGTFLGKFANYLGVYGVSFLIWGVSLSIYYLTLGRKRFEKYKLISIIFLLLSLGLIFLRFKPSSRRNKELKVTLVQPNIPQQEKLDSSKWKSIAKKTLSLLPGEFREKELVIFPETAYPDSYRNGEDFFEILGNLAQQKKASFLVGSYYKEKGSVFNSAFLITPKSFLRYDKVNIVPFGEYLPLRPYLSWLPYRYIGYQDLSPGSFRVLNDKERTLGVGICFESGNPFLARKMAIRGGEALIYLTNDAWFDGTFLPPQHFEITRMRAIETGLDTIQVANTGRSGIVNSDGEIIAQLPLKERGILKSKIYLRKNKNFFVKYGFYFNYFCLFLLFASVLNCFWKRLYSSLERIRALMMSLLRAL